MTAFYHVRFVVPDLDRAIQDFQRAAGVEWSDPVSDRLGEWDYRIVFTTGGPPFIELVEGPSGSPWDAGPGRSNGAIGRLTSGHASAGPAAGHLAPAIGKGQAGRPGPISHEPEPGAEGSGLPSTQSRFRCRRPARSSPEPRARQAGLYLAALDETVRQPLPRPARPALRRYAVLHNRHRA
ncbi:VOC family protein [Streptomyces sp. WAC01526]|uniref:VOC family protein n=1 Tax=Streptomyces sp. WAC01526 TaxID=2588709 RepID=UPI001652964E|nr:VOC family protein [Streptomyces sp. WAC01526]